MPGPTPTRADLPDLADVEALVRRWRERADGGRREAAARRLAGLLRDGRGVEFARGFVDRVLRPEDVRAAARSLERLSRRVPRSYPWPLRVAILLGGGFGLLLPWVVVPAARWIFRRLVDHLVLDGRPNRLGRAIERIRTPDVRLAVHPLGETVLGDHEAARRLRDVRDLLARDDVDEVSFGLRDVLGRPSPWGFAAEIERAVERLRPLARDAAGAPASLTLEVSEYRDLDLTVAVFTRLLDAPDLRSLDAAIVLPALYPDSFAVLQELTAWARRRIADGGAPIGVRLVKGANLPLERVEARLHGWPLAAWGSKVETDAAFARMLDWALRPEHVAAVRVGVAGHDPFDLAFALLLAERRRVRDRVGIELRLGVAPALADAVREDAGSIRLHAPLVPADRLDTAIPVFLHLLDEAANPEGARSGRTAVDDEWLAREGARFAASLARLDESAPRSLRTQDRLHPDVPRTPAPFANEPDTDPSIPANRAWAAGILERAAASGLGVDTVDANRVTESSAAARVAAAVAAGGWWSARPAAERAEALHRVGEVLAAFRGRLIEVSVAETGTTIVDADAEVSEAVDLAHHCAELALGLDRMAGAAFVPSRVALVLPPWFGRLATPAGAVLAALAAGSAVLLVPAARAARCGAVLAEAVWEAGIPREVLQVAVAEGEAARRALVTAPGVERVLLAGEFETAERVRSWRPELPLLAETTGVNSIVVTPSADLDLAVADLVRSAYLDAGQHHATASIGILVGSLADSARVRRQLVDAVSRLRVGSPFDPATQLGPVVEPVSGRLARGLTRLEEGESWLVKPRALDDTDRLWTPGVRDEVRPRGDFHRAGYLGPVLGLVRAATLDEAIELQNAAPSGFAAGIHSLDVDEIATWLARAEAGTLVVNRPITGSRVRRNPAGGWKRTSLGPCARRGGPNALLPLGTWRRTPAEPDGDLRLDGLDALVRAAVEAFQSALDYDGFAFVRRAAYEDEAAWAAEFARSVDRAGLEVERNILRYRPAVTWVRSAEGAALAELARVVVAGIRARATLRVSSAEPVPSALLPLLDDLRIATVDVERDDVWAARVAAERPSRVRLVGGDPGALARTVGAPDVAVWADEATTAGRIELLPFLCEQTVSITAHRFGTIDPALRDLPV